MTRYLGIVPARAGSKGIPGKNMADLGGKPMLRYTLEAARGASRLDAVVLTTDDDAAIALAEETGVPTVRRPAELARDDAPLVPAVLHALDAVGDAENVVLLQPTSPFRDERDIDAAVEAFESAGRSTLMSVDPVAQHPCEVVRPDGNRLEWAVEWPPDATGRQGLPDFYYVNGAIYVATAEHLRRGGRFQEPDSALYVMEPSHSFDIDEPFDLELARGLLAVRA
ncbi:MAG: cytidylyltransferase domain-containing protein [Gaiellaceae bacterium]